MQDLQGSDALTQPCMITYRQFTTRSGSLDASTQHHADRCGFANRMRIWQLLTNGAASSSVDIVQTAVLHDDEQRLHQRHSPADGLRDVV